MLTVDLAPCAFHDLVDDQLTSALPCARRVIRGVLHQAGGPLEVDELLRSLPLIIAIWR